MEENNGTERLNSIIVKVDWEGTTQRERESFSKAVLTFELASQAKNISRAVSKARMSTLILSFVAVGALMLFSVEPGIILGTILALQMVLLGSSQFFEYGTNVLVNRSEKAVYDLAESLAKRRPAKDGNDNMFIL